MKVWYVVVFSKDGSRNSFSFGHLLDASSFVSRTLLSDSLEHLEFYCFEGIGDGLLSSR